MKNLMRMAGALALLAMANAHATIVSIGNTFLGCNEPRQVAMSASGAVWTGCIGKLTQLSYFPGDYGVALPPPIGIDKIDLPSQAQATSLAFDHDGNIWFTDYWGDRIGMANVKTKSVALFTVPAGSRPDSIVVGGDGNLYVAAFGTGGVLRMTPQGTVTTIHGLGTGHHARGLLVNGTAITYGDFDNCRIYEYSTLFQITAVVPVTCQKIYDLTVGPDGLVWYAGGTKIGKLTTSGPVAYDPAPGTIAVTLAAAPDGTLWYGGDSGLVSGQARIGQITTTGVATNLPIQTTIGTIAYVTVRQSDGMVYFSLPGNDKQGSVSPAASTAPDATVVEFYNSALKHYFITASAAEAAGIDSGAAGPGWARTGQTFKAWSTGPLPNASPVCRFYGNSAAGGPNSHFFTVVAQECAAVQTDPGWILETTSAYWIVQPGAQCPAFTLPVYRAYNNGFAQHDSNHRFTTDLAAFNTMGTQGWAKEGVVMCSPH